MNSKQRKTLTAIFSDPVRSDIKWNDVEALFAACDGSVEEVSLGVCVEINGIAANFHRPHQRPEADKEAVKSVRRFPINAGVVP